MSVGACPARDEQTNSYTIPIEGKKVSFANTNERWTLKDGKGSLDEAPKSELEGSAADWIGSFFHGGNTVKTVDRTFPASKVAALATIQTGLLRSCLLAADEAGKIVAAEFRPLVGTAKPLYKQALAEAVEIRQKTADDLKVYSVSLDPLVAGTSVKYDFEPLDGRVVLFLTNEAPADENPPADSCVDPHAVIGRDFELYYDLLKTAPGDRYIPWGVATTAVVPQACGSERGLMDAFDEDSGKLLTIFVAAHPPLCPPVWMQ